MVRAQLIGIARVARDFSTGQVGTPWTIIRETCALYEMESDLDYF